MENVQLKDIARIELGGERGVVGHPHDALLVDHVSDPPGKDAKRPRHAEEPPQGPA